MKGTVGLVLMFVGAFLIYEALAPDQHKLTTAAAPTAGSSGQSGLGDKGSAGGGSQGGGGSSW